jgi:serine/threonine protein kinase
MEIKEAIIHNVRYQVNKILGSGKSAVVYLATDTTHNRLVALKTIEVRQNDPVQLKMVENEIKCLQLLQKYCESHVLCYIDSGFIIEGKDKTYYVIVSKFLEDYITWKEFKSLNKNIKEATKNIRNATQFIAELNIFHGDLHDENIMIHPEKLEVRIIDFGHCQLNLDAKKYNYDVKKLESYL